MFWRGVIGYLPVQIVQGVVGLLTLITFTRLLDASQFGDYALGFSAMSLVHTAVFTWNEAAMARFWAGEAGAGRGGHHAATAYRTWMGLLVVLPLAILAVALIPLGGGLKLALLAGLAAVLPRTLVKLVQERRRAAGEVRSAALLDIVQTAGGFAIGAVLAWRGLGGASPLLGAAIAAALCIPFVLRDELGRMGEGRFEPARARSNAAFGVPVAASLILALVLSTTDRFLLSAFLDETAVGHYHAGYSLANRALDVIFIWLGSAGGPALIMALERGGSSALAAQARQQASLMLLIALPAAAGVALTATPLAELMIGPALRAGATLVTPWVAASGLLAGLTTYYFHQAFTLGKRPGLLLLAMTIPALANVALNLVLIPALGLKGALIATLASYGLGLAASALLGRRSLGLPIPWIAMGQCGLATALMALAVVQVPPLGGLIELVLKAGVGASVYGAIVYLIDAGGLRSRASEALRVLRARPAS